MNKQPRQLQPLTAATRRCQQQTSTMVTLFNPPESSSRSWCGAAGPCNGLVTARNAFRSVLPRSRCAVADALDYWPSRRWSVASRVESASMTASLSRGYVVYALLVAAKAGAGVVCVGRARQNRQDGPRAKLGHPGAAQQLPVAHSAHVSAVFFVAGNGIGSAWSLAWHRTAVGSVPWELSLVPWSVGQWDRESLVRKHEIEWNL